MVVGAARDDRVAAFLQTLRHQTRVREHLLLVDRELRLEGFLERDGLRGDHMHQRTALRTGEHAASTRCVSALARARESCRRAGRAASCAWWWS